MQALVKNWKGKLLYIFSLTRKLLDQELELKPYSPVHLKYGLTQSASQALGVWLGLVRMQVRLITPDPASFLDSFLKAED